MLGVLAAATPAWGHASIPASAAFGFEPNPAGGSGALNATAPYAPNAFTTIYLRAPFEQTAPFNGSPDTTVDLKVTVPDGWTNPQCGPAKVQTNSAATANTNQPGPDVPGWNCEVLDVSGRKVLHWSGPQVAAPATAADSPQFFVFSVVTPAPAAQTTYDGTGGTEGFIADQAYASGEIVHWIPNAAFTGTPPSGSETSVATGLVRTVSGPGSRYSAVSPVRILDSRGPLGGWNAPLGEGAVQSLTVTGGSANVPGDAEAVVLNVTVTGASADSYLSVFPAGTAAPNASNLNFSAGKDVANLVVAKVGAGGQISMLNAVGSTHVVADLVGFFSSAGTAGHIALDPTRLLDSRTTLGGWNAKLAAGSPQTLQVRGVGGVSNTASSVMLNVTATGASDASFLSVYPSGEATPTASNLNFSSNQDLANLVVVKVGSDGRVAFANGAGSVDVVADVVGYFEDGAGSVFHALNPARVLDSRSTVGGWNAPLGAAAARALKVSGIGGVRTDARAILANITAADASASGYLTAFPTGATTPDASTLNFASGQTVPNMAAVKVGTGGQVSLFNAVGSTNVIIDVVGYFSAS